MKLLTKEIMNSLPALYSTEKIAVEEKIVICKFFTPWSNWSWFVFEAEIQEDGDYLFFGMAHKFDNECGYFLLSELQEATGPIGLKIERDRSIFKSSYKNCC